MKKCAKCEIVKVFSEFTFSRGRYESYCRPCKAERVKNSYKGKIKQSSVLRKKQLRDSLSDSYIIERLKQEYVPIEKIPQLIEIKRLLIKLKRELNAKN